jgi:CheY-like chemotaxis protein
LSRSARFRYIISQTLRSGMEEATMHILLVDDDTSFRATLWRLLARGGRAVQVEEATDGEEAVRLVATRRPDVVLMDLTMPRMSGVEATRRLKTRWPDLPVIVLTVHDDPVYERTARAAGADRFLLKKTAGTALWPALVSLVPPSGSAGPDRALISSHPRRTADPPEEIGRTRDREDSPGPFGNLPAFQACVQPL